MFSDLFSIIIICFLINLVIELIIFYFIPKKTKVKWKNKLLEYWRLENGNRSNRN